MSAPPMPNSPRVIAGRLAVPLVRPQLGWAACCAGLAALSILLLAKPSLAQEALLNAMTVDRATELRAIPSESQPYNFKSGDFRLLVTPSLGVDWNSNINTSQTDVEQDFILRPLVQLDMSYPVTEKNTLRLNVGFGYDLYLEHDDLSTWFLQSGSALSFDFVIKDVTINLHNSFSYTQDPSQQPAVANTADYGNFVNTIGFLATWDLRDVTLSLGFDHQNQISLADQFNSQNQASQLLLARAGLHVHPQVVVGVEGTGSFTDYQEPILNDSTGFSVGVYADWQLGTYFHLIPRLGYAHYFFQQTSATNETSNVGSYYFDLTVRHDITEAVSYSLSMGHNLQLGVSADLNEVSYVRPSVTWRIIKDLSLTTSFSYEHGNQGVGNVAGSTGEIYDWLSANVGLSRPLTERVTLALNYRYTWRTSDQPDNGYTQNLVGLLLTYRLP